MSAPSIPIHFENENLVIAIKPAGTLSVPSRLGEKEERPVLGKILETQLNCRLFPVHRLDFEVSGLIIFAKNQKTHQILNQAFEHKKIKKTYLAQTTGVAPEKGAKFEWKAKILRGKKRAYESPVGKPSLTFAEYLGKKDEYLSWKLEPVTGRSHQLRFDLARHGYPIVGDTLYGSTVKLDHHVIELRAVSIEMPEDLAKVLGTESRITSP